MKLMKNQSTPNKRCIDKRAYYEIISVNINPLFIQPHTQIVATRLINC